MNSQFTTERNKALAESTRNLDEFSHNGGENSLMGRVIYNRIGPMLRQCKILSEQEAIILCEGATANEFQQGCRIQGEIPRFFIVVYSHGKMEAADVGPTGTMYFFEYNGKSNNVVYSIDYVTYSVTIKEEGSNGETIEHPVELKFGSKTFLSAQETALALETHRIVARQRKVRQASPYSIIARSQRAAFCYKSGFNEQQDIGWFCISEEVDLIDNEVRCDYSLYIFCNGKSTLETRSTKCIDVTSIDDKWIHYQKGLESGRCLIDLFKNPRTH